MQYLVNRPSKRFEGGGLALGHSSPFASPHASTAAIRRSATTRPNTDAGREQPSAKRKDGFRVVIKLSRECSGNNEPVRELLGSAKELWFGIEWLLRDFNAEKDKHPSLLPLVALKASMERPPKTGSRQVGPPGQEQPKSRRMKEKHIPNFRIVGWVRRGDFNVASQSAD